MAFVAGFDVTDDIRAPRGSAGAPLWEVDEAGVAYARPITIGAPLTTVAFPGPVVTQKSTAGFFAVSAPWTSPNGLLSTPVVLAAALAEVADPSALWAAAGGIITMTTPGGFPAGQLYHIVISYSAGLAGGPAAPMTRAIQVDPGTGVFATVPGCLATDFLAVPDQDVCSTQGAAVLRSGYRVRVLVSSANDVSTFSVSAGQVGLWPCL